MAKLRAYLEKGDELCRLRHWISNEEVENIYKDYKIENALGMFPPPLIMASILGLENMVYGFIKCAKTTNKNLETGETGEYQNFLWPRYPIKRTAFDIAIVSNYVGIAKLLFANASLECLLFERNSEGKLPVSMLYDSEHDEFILSTLEKAAKRVEVLDLRASTLTSIDNQQEPQSYIECQMDSHSYPVSQKNKARKSLEKLDDGKLELTPNKNTILHLVSTLGDVEYVKDILRKHSSLIYNRNSKGETPTYVAAIEGHVDILEILSNHLKRKDDIELVLMRMTDKQTALHIAVKNHHVGVVFWLMKKTPQQVNHVNDFEESPLYLAVERGYAAILKLMSEMCNARAFKGPNGLTALHAAVILESQECIRYLLSIKTDLLYNQDNQGWSALHFAVFHNNFAATRALLDANNTIGYQTITVDGVNSSAIHIATSKGYCEIMDVLMSKCPGSTEIIDGKGRNILHVAIDKNQIEAIKFIFRHESLTTILINERDGNGNTPVHLLMASDIKMSGLLLGSRVDLNVHNNEKLSPLNMASSDENRTMLLKGITLDTNKHEKTSLSSSKPKDGGDAAKKKLEIASKVVENILIVVTLIATATFAAAFTVPGGFRSNEDSKQGTPFLLRKPAFIAFVVSNTIAFSCSCSVLFGHVVLVFNNAENDEPDEEEIDSINARTVVMYSLTAFAMLTMAIAFVTGLYVVLTPSLGLAIFSCVMSFFIIGITLVFPKKTRRLLNVLYELIM